MRPALSPCLVGCVRARGIKKGRGEEGEGGGLKEYFYMTMGERELFFLHPVNVCACACAGRCCGSQPSHVKEVGCRQQAMRLAIMTLPGGMAHGSALLLSFFLAVYYISSRNARYVCLCKKCHVMLVVEMAQLPAAQQSSQLQQQLNPYRVDELHSGIEAA